MWGLAVFIAVMMHTVFFSLVNVRIVPIKEAFKPEMIFWGPILSIYDVLPVAQGTNAPDVYLLAGPDNVTWPKSKFQVQDRDKPFDPSARPAARDKLDMKSVFPLDAGRPRQKQVEKEFWAPEQKYRPLKLETP